MPARILLVDDNVEARAMLALLLREEGFVIFVAEDGLAALELVESAQPDLIITDLQMPNLDGIDLIKALRSRPQFSKIPILLVSALCASANSLAVEAGADATAEKPIQVDYLIDLVRHLLPGPNA